MGNKRRYAFNPVGMDAFDRKASHPEPGAPVVFSNQGRVSHRAGSYRHVEGAESGVYHGTVLKTSLVPLTKKNPNGKPDALEAARAASLINDRRLQGQADAAKVRADTARRINEQP